MYLAKKKKIKKALQINYEIVDVACHNDPREVYSNVNRTRQQSGTLREPHLRV